MHSSSPRSYRVKAGSSVLARILAAASLFSTTVVAQQGLDQPEPFAPFLNGVFPPVSPGSTPGGSWATQNAYPNLSFPEPVRIVDHPRENKLVVVSKTGPIWIFTDSPQTTSKQILLNLSSKANFPGVGEGGVTGFAFHPEFGVPTSPNRGYIYAAYRFAPGESGETDSETPGYNRISRFTVADGSSTANLNSEFILINQYDRQQWHIGGDMFFGSDGFLYIGVGDEGNAYDRSDSTQRINGGLWSGILRIDVDNDPNRSAPISRQPKSSSQINSGPKSQIKPLPVGWPASFTQGYSIPFDNPFVDRDFNPGQGGEAAVLGEFYAIGMRHPWAISQDPDTAHIWYADVGEYQREEIGRVVKGGNHQWGFKEGFDHAGPIHEPSPLIGTSTPPVLDYSHTIGKAVIGAGVYRGEQFPELQGKYLFSDFTDGQLWAIDAADPPSIAMRNKYSLPDGVDFIMQLPSGFSAGINAFGLTDDGRVLLAKSSGGSANGGLILKLVRQGIPTPQPPALLSQTGAFADLATLTPASGFIPYSMVTPFWSDNAVKTRWIAIPNNGTHNSAAEKISFTPEGDWNFPVGSVLIKHFEMILDHRNPNVTKRLETRFLIIGNEGWYGATYRWNAAGTDAELLYGTELETLQITDTQGAKQALVWTYPSRNQCMTCHTPGAGGAIGPMTRQLNKDHFYHTTGRTANQLTTLSSLGIFETPIQQADLPSIPALKATDDSSATLTQRARSYLDSNCAYCHQPGGVRANFDARFTTPLADAGILSGALVESLGIPGEAVVAPGDISRSILYHRANSAGEGHSMPPLAKFGVHTVGVAVLADWIYSLSPANGDGSELIGNNPSSAGNFSDAHHPSVFINKSDTFTNEGTEPVTVSLSSFNFHAVRKGNPVTPFVASIDGTNSFTVQAIGTTRAASEYQVGQNHFLFSNNAHNTFTLSPGTTIVTGFKDSYPDGSGWGGGSVIPSSTTAGNAEDDIWALLPKPLVLQTEPFDPSIDTASIVLGENIMDTNAGKELQVFSNLQRSMKFNITFETLAVGADGNCTELITNGSFEQTSPNPSTWERVDKSAVPGWDTDSPSATIEVWRSGFLGFPAQDGNQLVEMDASTLEQTLPTVPGATLIWSFHHRGRYGQDTVALEIGSPGNLSRINRFTTGNASWVKYEGSYIVPPGQTQTRISLVPIAPVPILIAANLIDNVSVLQCLPDRDGDGVPDSLDAFPNDPGESADSDGDGIGDNADPFPNDPTNGDNSDCPELIVNGSFEDTAPTPDTWLLIDEAGVNGWDSNHPADTIEVWKSGFFGVAAQDGNQLAEMDGGSLSQTLNTIPGAVLSWSFHHRGRYGNDTVALEIGVPGTPARIDSFTTGKNSWVKYQGIYVVPPGQTQTRFSLVPTGPAGNLGAANFIDSVSVRQCLPEPEEPEDRDGDGVPDGDDAFPDDPNESNDSDNDGTGDNSDAFPDDPNETTDSDGDGMGDNSDPFPNDPDNGGGGDPDCQELIVNGSFEQTTPKPATWLLIDKTDVNGWQTDAPGDTLEIWKSGFFGVPAQDGGQLLEMDGNSLEQTLNTRPGATLNWAYHHRGRDGFDTVALSIGAPGTPTPVITSTTGKSWQKYEGSYIVPAEQTQTHFLLTPVAAASTLGAANFIDNVSVRQCGDETPLDSDNDGIPDSEDAFPNDSSETADSDNDGTGDNADAFPDDPTETTDSDGDGMGDNSDPFPNDPDNGEGGDPVCTELITNGSFEQTSPKATTWLMIDKTGVTGWESNSPTGELEIWKSGFLGVPAQNGVQLLEMNGATLEQTLETIPGSVLNWSFCHRGRDGSDTVALDLGASDNLTRIDTFSSGKYAWVTYEGTYLVPEGQTQTRFVLTPVGGATTLARANFIDNISVLQCTTETPPAGDGLSNGSFEEGLDSWSANGVAIVSDNAYDGENAVDLKSGFIEQPLGGLSPGEVHTLYICYRSQEGVTGLLGDASISIDGTVIGEIHNGSLIYVDCNGFEFIPSSNTATLRIRSLESGNIGLLIDELELVKAPLPPPPASPSLKNGSFEDQTGLSGDNPHPCGFDLPGWLVTQENVDPIRTAAYSGWTAVDGNWVLDLSGHGPGGIAQTVTGLAPGSLHSLSFSYARHRYWNEDPTLRAHVFANGELLTTLQRNQSQKVPAWESTSMDIPANSDGSITIEFRSLSTIVGGGIILDDVRLSPASSED